jgi:hypothetical protein
MEEPNGWRRDERGDLYRLLTPAERQGIATRVRQHREHSSSDEGEARRASKKRGRTASGLEAHTQPPKAA